MSELYVRAVEIAKAAHAGQVDKANAPYITHPLRVAASLDGEDKKIVAMLHDVVEDSDWTLDRLRAENFPEAIVAAVDALTHRDGEAYFDAVRRAGANPIARDVKLADLRDNMDRTRLSGITGEDEKRLAKYAEACRILTDYG